MKGEGSERGFCVANVDIEPVEPQFMIGENNETKKISNYNLCYDNSGNNVLANRHCKGQSGY